MSSSKKKEVQKTRHCVICGKGELKAPYIHDYCLEQEKKKVIEDVYSKFKKCVITDSGLFKFYEYVGKMICRDKYGIVEMALNDCKCKEANEMLEYIISIAEKGIKSIVEARSIAVLSIDNGKCYCYRRWYGRWYYEVFDLNDHEVGRLVYLTRDIPKIYINNTRQEINLECLKAGFNKMEHFISAFDVIGHELEFSLIDYATTNISDIIGSNKIGMENCVSTYNEIMELIASEQKLKVKV